MKKLLQLFSLMVISSQLAYAQPALDFTETDINGVEHNLFSYLDAGKIVVLDVSATWCGPCWGLHQRHTLKYLQEVLGPTAMKDVVVIFYEGDASTTSDDLNGTGPSTLGDWVTGVNYPIIDPSVVTDEFLDVYAPEGFPTVSVICPENKEIIADVYDQDYKGMLDQLVRCGTISDFSDALAIDYVGYDKVCSDFNPSFEVLNGGTEDIENLEFQLIRNGEVLETVTEDAVFPSGEIINVDFTSQTLIDDQSSYSINIVNVDENNNNNTLEKDVSIAETIQNSFTVYLETDEYAVDDPTTWRIEDVDGNIVVDGGMLANNATVETIVNLDSDACYSFLMLDEYGDGMTGVMELRDELGNVLSLDQGFGFVGAINFSTSMLSNLDDLDFAKDIIIAPSPVEDFLNLSFVARDSESLNVKIFNVSGSLLYKETVNTIEGYNKLNINTANFESGLYTLTMISADGNHSTKFVKI